MDVLEDEHLVIVEAGECFPATAQDGGCVLALSDRVAELVQAIPRVAKSLYLGLSIGPPYLPGEVEEC